MSDNNSAMPINIASGSFNNEVIWDNTQDLFSKYFKSTMYNNRYRFTNFELDPDLDFNTALNILNSIKL